MRSIVNTIQSAFILVLFNSMAFSQDKNWTQWRGLNYDGIANNNQNPPVKFSKEDNVVWSSKIPGRGHGSPTLYGGYIFIATADEAIKTQSLICLNEKTGEIIWNCKVHDGGFPEKSNKKASQASSTPATDGKLVYINFFLIFMQVVLMIIQLPMTMKERKFGKKKSVITFFIKDFQPLQ